MSCFVTWLLVGLKFIFTFVFEFRLFCLSGPFSFSVLSENIHYLWILGLDFNVIFHIYLIPIRLLQQDVIFSSFFYHNICSKNNFKLKNKSYTLKRPRAWSCALVIVLVFVLVFKNCFVIQYGRYSMLQKRRLIVKLGSLFLHILYDSVIELIFTLQTIKSLSHLTLVYSSFLRPPFLISAYFDLSRYFIFFKFLLLQTSVSFYENKKYFVVCTLIYPKNIY